MKLKLSEWGYRINSTTNVWSKPDYSGIAYSDGDEVEQRIAAIINQASDLTVLSAELRQHCTDWPSLYHLSNSRANILRPFESSLLHGNILEIGAGCGAITRYLGECKGNVLALEGSARRAAIARSRTRDLPNVTVVADNFEQFQCNEQFDIVTLIGVLEYANLFINHGNPALSMLQRVRSLLKPKGKLIIAIENQLGLKYFAGAPEDHFGKSMYGVENRYQNNQPQTYGRQALSEMLKQAGFSYSEFMAPFPDYKLPFSIVTEKGFSHKGFDAAALAWQSVKRDHQLPSVLAFAPELVWPSLVKNGVALDFSNSFLVVAGDSVNDKADSSILAWHFTTERSKEFCKVTRFLQRTNRLIETYCYPLSPDLPNHGRRRLLTFGVQEKAEYVQGKLLSQELIQIVTRDDWRMTDVGNFFKKYLEYLVSYASEQGVSLNVSSPESKIPGEYFDLIPQNIIVGHDGKWSVIDQEWVLNENMPVGWLLFRSLLTLINSVTRFGLCPDEFVNTAFGFIKAVFKAMCFSVTEEQIESYGRKELVVQEEVCGRKLEVDQILNSWRTAPLQRLNLNQALIEHDGQIAELNQIVSNRDEQIANRHKDIVDLREALVDRDLQITSLHQSAAERDTQIVNLNQSVAERDSQITSLSQSVAEREVQINNLNQVVTARDSQIFSLSQSVSARDGQIANLSQSYNEAVGTIEEFRKSTSWRLTAPMRFVSSKVKNIVGVLNLLPNIVRYGDGIVGSVKKACRVFAREGWRGVKKRILFVGNNQNDITASSEVFTLTSTALDEAHTIPRIEFDQTTNNYVEYKKNEPINPLVKLIAFYLPQFHPIPENNAWWGKDFTEWTNVMPAKPQFEGHYQPRIPGELGYYNLLDPSVQRRQVELAKLYGIGGFCFHFYWFAGKRLLEKPIENYLNDKTLDLPFCLCWANENWTRRWDGREEDILISQHHTPEDDLGFIQHVAQYMHDARYIRINGKPLVMLYRPGLLPSAKDTARRWRNWCRDNGIGEIYLAYTQSFDRVDPSHYGFDAAVEFPPNNSGPPDITKSVEPIVDNFKCTVFDWPIFVARSERFMPPPYKLFRGVCPSWDNTARRKNKATIFVHNTPNLYQLWLENAINDTVKNQNNPDERLVFINAWNEWAEGAYLEPDQKYGYAYLNATRQSLISSKVKNGYDQFSENGLFKHEIVRNTNWQRIKAIFGKEPNSDVYYFLVNYTALLSQFKKAGIFLSVEHGKPHALINGKKTLIDEPKTMANIFENNVLVNKPNLFCFLILQYNKLDLTEHCIASIRRLQSGGHAVHIIVVDNNSEPPIIADTKSRLEGQTDITLLFAESNLGFSKGNNLGYDYARSKLKADFIAVINNDIIIEQPDFILRCRDLFQKWAYSVLGPDVVIPDGRQENPWNDYIYDINDLKSLCALRNVERDRYLKTGHPEFCKIGKATPGKQVILNPMLQGAAIILSPIFIKDHSKVFDERLFLYGEEFILAQNCLLKGHLTVYSNEIKILHDEGKTTETLPDYKKMTLGYEAAIKSLDLCQMQLSCHTEASQGIVIQYDNEIIDELLNFEDNNILLDLLFCQPGYHGGGEYGKAVFKSLAHKYASEGGMQLWVALNPNLYIDPWVWELCKNFAINIISVQSFDDIKKLVNMDRFSAFFAPAIVVYATGYEYMKRPGTSLGFSCKETRIIGTLLDVRDYEIFSNCRQIEDHLKNIGVSEKKKILSDFSCCQLSPRDMAEKLRVMYRNIISDKSLDTLITISEYSKRSILKNIGDPLMDLKVLMPPMKFRPAPKPFEYNGVLMEKLNYAIIVNAGRIEKNAASAVVAFDNIFSSKGTDSSFQDLKVVLTGLISVEQIGLKNIKNKNRFVSLAELNGPNYEYLLKNACFLVFPSFNEGLGYPPLEAMSYGTPCVVSDATAIPEACGNVAVYFDPFNVASIENAILEIIGNPIEENALINHYKNTVSKQDQDMSSLCNVLLNKL